MKNLSKILTYITSLFKPAQIVSGAFQDGGLRYNNPLALALSESRVIWSPGTLPDIVLSLGTSTEEPHPPKAPHFCHVFNGGFVPRLCRSFMSSLNGEHAWKEFKNRLDESTKADYFRFNVPFTANDQRLDDVNQMNELKKWVHLQPNGQEDRLRAASALLVASFFFELSEILKYEAGVYVRQGLIRCRDKCDLVIKSLTRIHGYQLKIRHRLGYPWFCR